MSSDPSYPAKALLDPLRASIARQVQAMPGYPRIFDAGAAWSLKAVARTFPWKWVRDLAEENRNKLHAFTEFQNTKKKCSGPRHAPDLFAANPHRTIWRAEGLGAHLAGLPHDPANPVPLRERGSRSGAPPNFLLALHTGGGLTLAGEALQKHRRSLRPRHIGATLEEFQSLVDRHSESELRPAVFEALGLVLQTMHPDLLDVAANHLRERNPAGYRLMWHGVGRGHYFDPFHLMVPSNLRDRSYLSATDEAALNRLSGFAWAATMVNLRSPGAAAAALAHLPLDHPESIAAAADGVGGAALVWLELTFDRSPLAPLREALFEPGVFRNPSVGPAIVEALTRRIAAHPASAETLAALFSFFD